MKIYIEAQKLRVTNPDGKEFELYCIDGKSKIAHKTKEHCYVWLKDKNSMILELTIED